MPLIIPDSSQIPTVVGDSTTVTTEALRGLNPDTLVHEIKRLQDSVMRLQDSNRQIERFVQESCADLDEKDKREMANACQDNEGTIARQGEIVDKLFCVLREKIGEKEIESHYGLRIPGSDAPSNDEPTPMQEDQPGVFL